ncbi:MAG: DALR domain-containing protein, partial [Nitrososphaerota archaeon]
HYRSSIDFNETAMLQAEENLGKITSLLDSLSAMGEGAEDAGEDGLFNALQSHLKAFVEAMSYDFNTPQALAEIYAAVNTVNSHIMRRGAVSTPSKVASVILELCNSLGLLRGYKPRRLPSEAEKMLTILLEIRRELRRRGDYALADKIRTMLGELGVTVEDTRGGERVRISL